MHDNLISKSACQGDTMEDSVCFKCKTKRSAYVTDDDPATLKKYKTCDKCRQRNKIYKKNQKKRLLQKMKDITGLTDPYVMDGGATYLPSGSNAIGKQDNMSNFESYLEAVSQIDQQDVSSLKFSAEVSNLVIQRCPAQILSMLVNGDTSKEAESLVYEFKEKTKKKLKTHYIRRIEDILSDASLSFKIRSTNWKLARFYCQMCCDCDIMGYPKRNQVVGTLIEESQETEELANEQSQSVSRSRSPSPQVAHPRNKSYRLCDSKFNFSFDTSSGKFTVEISHTNHSNLMTTNPSDVGSILHPLNSSQSIAREWYQSLQKSSKSEKEDDMFTVMGGTINSIPTASQ